MPQPLAPYPQDYIIDQQGIVRYWSDQFDPQAVIATIDRLLASGVSGEPVRPGPDPRPGLAVLQSPSGPVIRFRGRATGRGTVELLDPAGRVRARVELDGDRVLDWTPGVGAGVYFLRLVSESGPATAPVVVVR